MEYIKKLRMCVRFFQEFEGDLSLEHEKLIKMFEAAEKKSNELGMDIVLKFISLMFKLPKFSSCIESYNCYIEMLMNAKEEELNSIIAELQTNNADLQEKFMKEEAEKLVHFKIRLN